MILSPLFYSGVGKTALMVRFSDGGFQSEMAPTIGVDFKIKYMETTDGKRVKVQLWDTAGQERFRTITTHYYRGANGVMVVFDLSSRQYVLLHLPLNILPSFPLPCNSFRLVSADKVCRRDDICTRKRSNQDLIVERSLCPQRY